MKLRGEIALITGAASGIGAGIAQHFAGQGAKLILVDINKVALEQVAAKLGAAHYGADITAGAPTLQMFDLATREVGTPRILVNAAGILGSGKILGKDGPMDLDVFSKVININLIGAFNMLRLCADKMSRHEPLADGERGVVINIGSIASEEGQIGQSAYSAAKAGLAGLTLPAARELARYGIRVVTIAPGLVDTNMLSTLTPDAKEALASSIPFPKRLAKPEEIASLAQQIVENPMLNGCTLRIDGALRMGA